MKSLLLEDLVMNWRLSPPHPVTASVLALFKVLFVFMGSLAFLSSFSRSTTWRRRGSSLFSFCEAVEVSVVASMASAAQWFQMAETRQKIIYLQ